MNQTILDWLVYTVAIAISAYLIPGVVISDLIAAVVLAVVLGAINAFIRPILIILTLPITIVTFGLFILVINALLIMLAGTVVPGFEVSGFWAALIFSIVLSLVSALLGGMSKVSDQKV